MTEYLYCFIRKDLLTVHQIIQLAHCAFEAGKSFGADRPHPHICLLEVKDLAEYRKAYQFVSDLGIEFESFFEPDTKNGKAKFPIGYSAIMTQPISDPELRDQFKRFKMYE